MFQQCVRRMDKWGVQTQYGSLWFHVDLMILVLVVLYIWTGSNGYLPYFTFPNEFVMEVIGKTFWVWVFVMLFRIEHLEEKRPILCRVLQLGFICCILKFAYMLMILDGQLDKPEASRGLTG
jgi:hypothetical protein